MEGYIGGQPAPVYVSNGLLRSVSMPVGAHTVELRYESCTLSVGIAISVVAYAAPLALAVAGAVRRSRKRADDTVGE